MNNEQEIDQYRESGLTPFQAKLVAQVLAAPVPVRHLLVASPGTGKTTAAVFLARKVAEHNAHHRLLVLVDVRVLASMYDHELKQALPTSRIMVTDRRGLRELEAESKNGAPLWPPPVVAIMSLDTARQEDVLRDLCSTTWDLVIVEEVRRYGRARWTLLKTILRNECFRRVLVMTATPELKQTAALLKDVPRTQWTLPELESWDGKRLFPERQTQLSTVAYRRSDAEIALLRNLVELTMLFSPSLTGQMARRILLKQASSSPLALEQTIRRLRNSLTHGVSDFLSVPGIEALDEDLEADTSPASSRTIWRDRATAFAALTNLIQQTESLTTDRKREAFEGLLGRLHADGRAATTRTCVFCIAKATASYLKTTLAARSSRVFLLTGEMASDELQASLQGFTNEGGVLVCTAIALQGIDLRGIEAFIHYDPPASATEMAVRISRGAYAIHYLLKDESNILPDEWPLAQ